MSELILSHSETKMVSHAINWVLNVPFEHTPQPGLPPVDADNLNRLLGRLIEALAHECTPLTLRLGGQLERANTILSLPLHALLLLNAAVVLFHNELASSPSEIAIVTGMPLGNLKTLVQRLAQGVNVWQRGDSAPAVESHP
jgi:hypothetical protein